MCGRPGALVQFLVVDSAAGMSAVVAHHFSGIGDLAEFARTVVNVLLQPPHASLIGARPRSSSGSLASFTVIRCASSRVSRFDRRAARRSDTSGIGVEAEVRGLRSETTLMSQTGSHQSVEAISVLRFRQASAILRLCCTIPCSKASYGFPVFRCIQYSPSCAKVVHEKTHARSGRANHLRERVS